MFEKLREKIVLGDSLGGILWDEKEKKQGLL